MSIRYSLCIYVYVNEIHNAIKMIICFKISLKQGYTGRNSTKSMNGSISSMNLNHGTSTLRAVSNLQPLIEADDVTEGSNNRGRSTRASNMRNFRSSTLNNVAENVRTANTIQSGLLARGMASNISTT